MSDDGGLIPVGKITSAPKSTPAATDADALVPVGKAAGSQTTAPTTLAKREEVAGFPHVPEPEEVAKTIVPPVVNTLDYPIRDVVGRAYGMMPWFGGAVPIDEASRKKFYDVRQRVLDLTALPETEGGKVISDVAAIPGQVVGAGVDAASRAIIGPKATTAIAPYAGLAADVAPIVGGELAAARAATKPLGMIPEPAAVSARDAGYRLPPEEISEQPSVASRLMSATSGKVKKQQAFSEVNQANTNRLAAKALGLPASYRAKLTPATLEKVRKSAGAVYDKIRTVAPETVLGADPDFRQAIGSVGARSAEVEAYFPETERNPSIMELRADLLRNATAPTDAVMKKIADLRADSQRNWRRHNDPMAHALGHAQRQAADVLEDAVERSISYGKNRISAFADRDQAAERLTLAQQNYQWSLSKEPWEIDIASRNLASAEKEFTDRQTKLNDALAGMTPKEIADAKALRQQFRDARTTFARSYDIEAATNPATGDVRARRIAALRSGLKRPLTGELAQIADAADAFPRQMQSDFGGLEDWSVLDMFGGGAALASGHPIAAMDILLGRPLSRAVLRSPQWQERMFTRPRPLTNPAAGVVMGTLAVPQNLQDKRVGWSPSQKRWYDQNGRMYDQNGVEIEK